MDERVEMSELRIVASFNLGERGRGREVRIDGETQEREKKRQMT